MIEDMLKALDENNIEFFRGMMHDEFVYVDDFAMETKDDWLEEFEAELKKLPIGFFKN